MTDSRNNRHRNTYLLLIGAGVFLLAHKLFGFATVISIFFILLGIHRIRSSGDKKGFVLVAVGGLILLGNHLTVVIAVILISLGLFYLKSKDIHKDDAYLRKQSLLESIRWVKDPWVLRSMSIWSLIGEIRMDLSLAILEEPEVTIVLQGIIGDIDLIVPEDIGASVQCNVFFGQADVGLEKEAGVINKIAWQSPQYELAEHKVNLVVAYVVGDINVKVL